MNAFTSPVKLSDTAAARSDTEKDSNGRGQNVLSGFTNFLKLTDGRFAGATKSTPLDVIDGIDFFIRFRLMEAGIYEVQNLAVANPILMHVETPYGIYQTIDWVGQAQLCCIVGPERFLILRQFNIRTIFDLERAVLSLKSTSELRRILGGILLMTTETMRLVEKLSGSNFPDMDHPQNAGKNIVDYMKWAAEKATQPTSYRMRLARTPDPRPSGGYHVWLMSKLGNEPYASFDIQTEGETRTFDLYEQTDPDATIKHMVRVIMDDLHVMRLRQIWESIGRTLGGDAATLDDSEDTFLGA